MHVLLVSAYMQMFVAESHHKTTRQILQRSHVSHEFQRALTALSVWAVIGSLQ